MHLKNISFLILFLFLVTFSSSCAVTPKHTVNSILPKESFVKIEVTIDIRKCQEQLCLEVNRLVSHSSGFIVKRKINGAYAVTAGHSCEEDDLINQINSDGFEAELKIKVLDLDLKEYKAKVTKIDRLNDLCMLYVKNIKRPALKLNGKKPVFGEKVYNLAAPMGIHDKNMTPILEGRYCGPGEFKTKISVYSIPAIGGSSGSPILNKRGRLVGMIHSVHRGFPYISFSPTTEILNDFISDNVE